MSSLKVLLFVLLMSVFTAANNRNVKNMFTIKVEETFTDKLLKHLERIKLYVLYKITPSVYIFKYRGQKHAHRVLSDVQNTFSQQIIDIEPVRVYNNILKPTQGHTSNNTDSYSSENLVCSHYYGMGVQKVWAKNITGKGVTIAIIDAGINTDLKDLKRNIGDCELCKNFIQNSTDVAPESFQDLLDKPPSVADHGNKVASIVAAEKDNNICSAGIAYDATIVVVKAYQIVLDGMYLLFNSSGDSISRSFVHELDKIDIFIHALAIEFPFDELDISIRAAIAEGATQGRKGLGTIYVVPAGPVGNALSHNRHTITVNCIGKDGSKPDKAIIDTSALVSGLRDGNNISASSMVTTSHGNKCVTDFKGISAAVAQVSSIIALGLQANPNLTLRDVQHILVKASDVEHLVKKIEFSTNGASLKFNNIFGFGLLNADKFVKLALVQKTSPALLSIKMDQYNRRTSGILTQIFEFLYCCDFASITHIEHVEISISFTTLTDYFEVKITSPSSTSSKLTVEVDKDKLPFRKEGRLVTVHFWDEVPHGVWDVVIKNKHNHDDTIVHNISITLHGTRRSDMDCKNMEACEKTNVSQKDSGSTQLYFLFFLVIIAPIVVLIVI